MPDVKTYFPEAEVEDSYTSAIVNKLENSHGFDLDKTILATSICSDEVIRSSANFRNHMEIDKPFQLGGLAGFPFAGATGFKAFAGHIPDAGGAIILYGPHIGITESEIVGKVLRRGQILETTCCGALVGVVNHLESDNAPMPDEEYDFQQNQLTSLLKSQQQQIMNSENPLMEATDRMFELADARIHELLDQTASHFTGKMVALVGGIIINTNKGKPDWFEERNFEVRSL